MFKKVLTVLLVAGGLVAVPVSVFAATPTPEPEFVMDSAGLFTASEELELEEEFAAAYENYDVVPVVETIDTLNGKNLEQYATERANVLGVGDENEDNGIYVLIVENDRVFRFETGAGITVPDYVTQTIVDEKVTPEYKEGNYVEGTVLGVNSIGKEQEVPGSVIGSKENESTQAATPGAGWRVFGIVGAVFIASAILFFVNFRKNQAVKAKRKKDLEERIATQRKRLAEEAARNKKVYGVSSLILKAHKKAFISTDQAGRETIIRNLFGENDKFNSYERISNIVVENERKEYSKGLPEKWLPLRKPLNPEQTVKELLIAYEKEASKVVPEYKKFLAAEKSRKDANSKKSAEQKRKESEADKVWASLSRSQQTRFKKARSDAARASLLNEYLPDSRNAHYLVPLMIVLYSPAESARANSSSSSSYGSSSSSSSYTDYSSSSFGGGSFDGGGGSGSF